MHRVRFILRYRYVFLCLFLPNRQRPRHIDLEPITVKHVSYCALSGLEGTPRCGDCVVLLSFLRG